MAVIGAGYVGLPTAATLSHLGHHVTLAESDPRRYRALLRGELPIFEEGLDDLVASGVNAGRLSFVDRASVAVEGAEFVFLCVPTPQSEDGSADLTAIERAAREIGPHLQPGAVVVNKSTVPVGTVSLVESATGRSDISVVSNPEFLREGSAVADSLHPDRIVVGSVERDVAARVGDLFRKTRAPLIVTDPTTAESIKYASNAFLAVKISFVNALAGLCEAVGADVRDLVLGLGYDRRIGFEALKPGPGWGGSCLPKDTAALVHIAQDAGYEFGLVREAMAVNDAQLERMVEKIRAGAPLAGRTICVWGLTFKANTDDRRSSPAIQIVRRLVDEGARVKAFDPTVEPGTQSPDLVGVELCADAYEAARDASVIAILTEWDDFRRVDFEKVSEVMASSRIVDGRNVLDPLALRRLGFAYVGVGRR